MPEPKPVLLIVDTHALAHRAFHAFPADLKTKRGEHTNAIFGVASMLLQVIKQFQPDYVIAARDSKGATYRHELYDKYKANRPKLDESLEEQLPKIMALIETLKIPVIAQQGYEADDIIGSICKSPAYKGFNKIIVTGDRDLFQVLNGEVKVFLAGGAFSKSMLYDVDSATAKMGFHPDLTVDFKALKGDSSDNIPGVPGIGDKTAQELINKYETLDNVYAHLEEIRPAVKKKLESGKDMAYLSQKLAQIEMKVPVVLDLDNSELRDLDFEELKKLFEYYEFHSLIGRINTINAPQIPGRKQTNLSRASQSAYMRDIAGDTVAIEPVELKFESIELKAEEEIAGIAGKLALADGFVLYTDKPVPIFSKPERLYFALEDKVYGIGLAALSNSNHELLEKVFESGKAIVYDGKKETHGILNLGYSGLKYQQDLMLIDYLLQEGLGKVDLASSVQRYLNIKVEQDQQQTLFANDQGYTHAYEILLLKDILLNKFQERTTGQKWDLKRLYKGVEMPLTAVLVKLERKGIRLEPQVLQDFAAELDSMIASVQQEIFKAAGEEFNISSPKQLGYILFEKIKVPSGKKTKAGAFSTNEKVLLDNVATFPIIADILTYRELFKLKSTYTKALIDQINPQTGRVHTTFNQAVVATGRLSSTDPNLQNIPTSTELGQRIRSAFVAAPGKQLVSFDYAQQELRLLAHFSNDEKLINYFVSGRDIHSATAAQLFNVPIDDVNKQQRRVGKTVNFGVVYGISAYGLADRLKIPAKEAQAFIDAFFASYPRVKMYFDELKADARNNGYVETLFGRRRNASGINVPNFQARAAAEREITNFPLQGSAADIMKLAMIKAEEEVEKKYSEYASMVLQVHDELIFEVEAGQKQKETEFIDAVCDIMSGVVQLNVPVNVSAHTASTWGELK